ncbi:hypothetical protein EK21DRAFT_106826 [Setomelanomma holmii]|uniref:Uncharacterized protein n=1 Tax=Setomelanomma holmii TaxID=210430 RepID=A0A9P4HMK9_9PLEO|nr:hypothetical protein EK21DRAFT_106826 [Setomelanomma holmii]
MATPDTAPNTAASTTAPKPATSKKVTPRTANSSIESSIATTASTTATPTPTARTTMPPSNPTVTPTPMTKTSLLYLAINGVPQTRVSGDTPEGTEMDKELQAMGLVAPENKLLGFDVRRGKVRGVRVGAVMFGRKKEKENGKE